MDRAGNNKGLIIAVWVVCLLGSFLLSFEAAAQNCNCDHTITSKTTYVDANKLAKPVKPGQTICLAAGKRSRLRLANFHGSESKYLTIKNCGGQTLLQNSPSGYGFAFSNCKYFKLTGTGDKKHKYGIKIDGTPKGSSGLVFGSKSTDFEVEYIEITRAGFAGIMSKTDPNCSQRDLRSFTQRNTHFHHNYIHDVGGEGFYVGYFAFPSRTITCSNKKVTIYPHPIENVSIHHNILIRTGWDAIQLGSAPKNASIHHNIVENFATANETYQKSGIQLNAGAAADIYNNIIIKGTGPGIAAFGYGGSKVYNNLIVDVKEDGIYTNDKTAQVKKPYMFINNTIVKPGRYGIGLAIQKIKGNIVANNLVVEPGALPKSGNKSYIAYISPSANYKLSTNLYFPKVSQVPFTNIAKKDYTLKKGAKPIDAGSSVKAYGITKDLADKARPAPNTKTDVGAYEWYATTACTDGTKRPCYSGAAGTDGKGPCKKGTETCNAGKWGACTGEVTPVPERCDGKDNDCDGKVDENAKGTPLTQTCKSACGPKLQTCKGGKWSACPSGPCPEPNPEKITPDAGTPDTSQPGDTGTPDTGGSTPDNSTQQDQAVGNDPGTSPTPDTNPGQDTATVQESSAGQDASTSNDSSTEPGGCSCQGSPSNDMRSLGLFFFLFLGLFWMRHRKKAALRSPK